LVVLVLPRIVTFALQRRMGKLFVVWQVQHATRVWLQAQEVASSGERIVPPGASVLWLTVISSVGSDQRSLHLPLPTATGTPIATATGTPIATPTGTPVPTASGATLPAAGGTPIPTAVGTSMSTAAASPPAIVLIPDLLSFGTQDVNTRSAAQDLHIVNLGPTAITIAGVTIGGANPHDFNAPDTCAGATIRVYNGCTIRVSFMPSLGGPRRASLVIADNAVDSPQTVPLSGTGRRTLS
jgi:hypothetical protein